MTRELGYLLFLGWLGGMIYSYFSPNGVCMIQYDTTSNIMSDAISILILLI